MTNKKTGSDSIPERNHNREPEVKFTERELWEVRQILRRCGLTLSATGKREDARSIAAVGTVMTCYLTYGGEVLYAALSLLVWTWQYDERSLSSTFIKGICLFTRAYAQSISYSDFVNRMRYGTIGLIKTNFKQNKMIQHRAVRSARAILIVYNEHKRTKYPLPDTLEETYNRAMSNYSQTT